MVHNDPSDRAHRESSNESPIPVASMVESIMGRKWSGRLLQLCAEDHEMTDRRSPHIVNAARAWDRFVSANAPIIAASGIPNSYLASVDHFDDFLMHGCLAHHPDDTDFQIESMNTDQYAKLVLLVETYFAAGYEWFAPVVLRPAEQRRLGSRFGGAG